METPAVQLTCIVSGGDSGHSWCTVWFKSLQTQLQSLWAGLKSSSVIIKLMYFSNAWSLMLGVDRPAGGGCPSAQPHLGSSPYQTSAAKVTDPGSALHRSSANKCVLMHVCVVVWGPNFWKCLFILFKLIFQFTSILFYSIHVFFCIDVGQFDLVLFYFTFPSTLIWFT